VAVVGDAPVVADLDPGPQLVGEPGPTRLDERLGVREHVGRRQVVVADPQIEREPRDPFDRLAGDPRDGRDRRLDPGHR
jgi:hypothetical protein